MNELEDLSFIRPIEPGDRNFILATWLRGLYYGNSWFKEIDKDIYMDHYHRVIEAVLSNPETVVAVAALKEDSSTILGYSVLEPQRNAIHWVYVKDAWRKLGLAKRLVPEEKTWVTVTHLTDLGKSLKPKHIKFNPFFT